MEFATLAAVGAIWSTLIVPVSPTAMPGPRGSDAFINSMRERLFENNDFAADSHSSLPISLGPAEFAGLPTRKIAESRDGGRGSSPLDWRMLGFEADGPRRSLGRKLDYEVVTVNSKVVLNDPDWHINTPIHRSGWKAEDSVKLPFVGPLFVVGQVGANSDSVERQEYNLIGKTGLGLKLPEWLGGEIQLRTGRSKTNYDPDTETLYATEQVKTFVEVATRWPLAAWLNLEYTGQALPSAVSAERDLLKFKQDLRLAVPLSNSGQFHIGAKYTWDEAAAPTPWIERMKMYVGLEFKR